MVKICRAAGLAFLMLWGAPAWADDNRLAELHAVLAPMREALDASDMSDMRGATPALMGVKHALRDWVESHFSALTEDGDERALAAELNDELAKADLLCKEPQEGKDRCDNEDQRWDGTGFVIPLRLEEQEGGHLLVLRAALGIHCGEDESAYLYERRDGQWRRLWQSEQAIEPGKPYSPQHIVGVRTSWSPDQNTPRLVLSLGYETWCSSNWHGIYYRLWRVGSDENAAAPLLDRVESAFLGQHDPPIEGSVGQADALIEFTVASLDMDVFFSEAVRHYAIVGDRAERVDPIALTPSTFTEEWLNNDWKESARWTTQKRRDVLKPWHLRFHADHLRGHYIGAPRRCRKDADLWQVGIDFRDVPADKSIGTAYFFALWQAPYHFEMVDIRARPRPDCSRRGPSNGTLDTLFPIQGWR